MALTFRELPLGVREMIWREALPSNFGSMLFPWKKGKCWRHRVLLPGDAEYVPDHEELNLNFEFTFDKLDQDHVFELPLLSVNSESRRIALAWMRQQGADLVSPREVGRNLPAVEATASNDPMSMLCRRRFDQEHDALYVPPEGWLDFAEEPETQRFSDPYNDKQINLICPLRYLALSEDLFKTRRSDNREDPWLVETVFMAEFYTLRGVFIVRNTPPGLSLPPDDEGVAQDQEPPTFEFVNVTDDEKFFWREELHEFDFGNIDGEFDDNESNDLHALVSSVATKFAPDFHPRRGFDFEIRPVIAIQR